MAIPPVRTPILLLTSLVLAGLPLGLQSAGAQDSTPTAVRFLSDRVAVSGTSGWGPVERDRSNGEWAAGDGRALTVGGRVFAKGLGVHSASEVRYVVPAGCTQFRSTVGVDDEVGDYGSTVFQVQVDGRAVWNSGVRTGVQAGLDVGVPVTAGASLALVVTDAGDGPGRDHANWADARLLCTTAAPAPVPVPAPAPAPVPVPAPAPAPAPVSVTEPLAPAGGIFGPGSEWRRNIAGASLAANSRELTANLAGQVQRYYGHAAFNAYEYNATFYTVGAGTPRADVIWDDCQGKGYTPPQLYLQPGQPGFEGAHFRNVPMPANAVTAVGTDKSIAVYDPATDQLWEFWIAQKKADGWHACWGGRIDKASTAPGYFLNGMGSSATGLPTAGGMIRIKEIQAGRIDHALSLAIVDTENFDKVSYPAQRSDGYNPQRLPNAIWEGTRFRLDPTIDVNTLNLHPVAKIVARAAQQYGFIVTDKAGAVSVIAESGAGVQAATQSNPWGNRNATTGRMGPGLLGGSEAYQIMAGFPWDRMQALPVDYAKP